MTLHATSFGLYMASVLLFICIYVMFTYFKSITDKTYRTCYGIVFVCSSLSQAVLCLIFWDLGKKREPLQRQQLPIVTNQMIADVKDDEEIGQKKQKKPISEEYFAYYMTTEA